MSQLIWKKETETLSIGSIDGVEVCAVAQDADDNNQYGLIHLSRTVDSTLISKHDTEEAAKIAGEIAFSN